MSVTASSGIKTAPLVSTFRVNIEDMKKDMQKATGVAVKEAEEISKKFEDVAKVGEDIANVGEKAIKGLTLPAIGAATALGTMAYNTENALGTIESKLGVTGEEAERLKGIAKGIYKDGFGESVEDSIEVVGLLQSQLKDSAGMTDEYKQHIGESILAMNEVFGTSSEEVTRTLKMMTDTGLTNDLQEGMDILTRGFQLGGDYSGELLDTVMEYSPQFEKLGLSADEAMNYLITGANNGAWSMDKVGDAMKEFSIRSIDGSKTTEEGFKAIGLNAKTMAKEIGKGGDSAKEAFKKTLKALESIEDPVKREQAGVALFGTMWEDMGQQAMLSLASVEGGLDNVDGANEKVLAKQKEQKEFTATWREFQDAVMPLGTEILKIAKDALPPVKEVISDIAEALNGMTDEQKENILKWTAMAAAIGPVLKIGGSTIETFGNLGKALSTIKDKSSGVPKAIIGIYDAFTSDKNAKVADAAESIGDFVKNAKDTKDVKVDLSDTKKQIEGVGDAAEAAAGAVGAGSATAGAAGASGAGAAATAGGTTLAGALAGLVLPATLAAGALAVVGLFAKGTADYMGEKATDKVDMFKDTVAETTETIITKEGELVEMTGVRAVKFDEATKKSLGAYLDLSDGVDRILYQSSISQNKITEEQSKTMISNYEGMAKAIIEGNNKKKDEALANAKIAYTDADGNLREGYDTLVKSIEEKNSEANSKVSTARDDALKIIQDIASQGGVITEQQRTDLDVIAKGMTSDAVGALTETEAQANVIRSRIKANAGTLSFEMATEEVQNAVDARDGQISAANETYKGRMEAIKTLNASGDLVGAEYDKEVADADQCRKDSIDAANKTYNGIIDEIRKANPTIDDEMDTQTGYVYNRWNKLANWFGGVWEWIKGVSNDAFNAQEELSKTIGPSPYYNYNGQNFVPYDGYRAVLHKGERVMTAEENYAYTQSQVSGSNAGSQIELNFYGNDNAKETARVVKNTLEDMGFGI